MFYEGIWNEFPKNSPMGSMGDETKKRKEEKKEKIFAEMVDRLDWRKRIPFRGNCETSWTLQAFIRRISRLWTHGNRISAKLEASFPRFLWLSALSFDIEAFRRILADDFYCLTFVRVLLFLIPCCKKEFVFRQLPLLLLLLSFQGFLDNNFLNGSDFFNEEKFNFYSRISV